MFEPIPNFGNSLPNRIIPLKSMRQLAMERATPVQDQAPNPFLELMLNDPAPVQAMVACEPRGERAFIFGLIKDKAPSDAPAKIRRQPQSYIFIGGQRVSTGPSKRWSGR